jgi:hypothetical protein
VADEAILRIQIDDGGRGGTYRVSPAGGGAPYAGGGAGAPPPAGRAPAAAKAEQFVSTLDKVIDALKKFSSAFGGLAGGLARFAADILSLFNTFRQTAQKITDVRDALASAIGVAIPHRELILNAIPVPDVVAAGNHNAKLLGAGTDLPVYTPGGNKIEWGRGGRGGGGGPPMIRPSAFVAGRPPDVIPAGEEAAEAGGIGAGAAIAGALAAVLAYGKVLDLLKDAAVKATNSLANFATTMVSPDTNPQVFVNAAGEGIKSTASMFKWVNPFLYVFGSALGEAVQGLSRFMTAIDGMVDRYKRYTPQLAYAEAGARVTQTLGDVRRAQEAAPALSAYVAARSDLQQKFEDTKIRILNRLLPLAIAGMESIGTLLVVAEAILTGLTSIAEQIPGLDAQVARIRAEIEARKHPKGLNEIMQAIRAGYVESQAAARRAGAVLVPQA